MTLFEGSFSTVLQINLKLLYATALAFLAYWVWPTEPHWWAFSFLSLCAGLAAAGLIGSALKSILTLYRRDKAIKDFLAQGSKPKSAKLASDDDLRNAGMR